jgi:hypothetical protein
LKSLFVQHFITCPTSVFARGHVQEELNDHPSHQHVDQFQNDLDDTLYQPTLGLRL